MVNAYAELTGDFTPIHVDEAYAKTTPFGTRVAPRPVRPVAHRRPENPIGLSLPARHVARLDLGLQAADQAGRHGARDIPRRQHAPDEAARLGHLVLPAELINQRGKVVQSGEHRLMIRAVPRRRPSHGNPTPAAHRHPRHRLQPLSRRPFSLALPGRAGRRGDQGRTPHRRRRRPRPRDPDQWPERLLPAAEHGQAGPVHRPEGQARPRAAAQAGPHRRRVRRELSSRRPRPARPGIPGPVAAESTADLLLGLGLRPHRTRFRNGPASA